MKSIPDESRWPEVHFAPIIPPIITKKAEKPKTLRKRGPNEPARVSRSVGCRCNNYHQVGHNKRASLAMGRTLARLNKRRRSVITNMFCIYKIFNNVYVVVLTQLMFQTFSSNEMNNQDKSSKRKNSIIEKFNYKVCNFSSRTYIVLVQIC